ncbi:MAG: hypothetical protein GTO18_20705 [Anaerolineales bacterium]|nr:hypothetical protein [Anaerolineales bacterium]
MTASQRPHLDVGALSHEGEKRENNEDSYAVAAYRLKKSSKPTTLAVVADGIGGHQAGEVASQITVESIVEALTNADGEDPIPQIHDAISTAGTLVAETSFRSSDFYGMGSTVAVAWVIEEKLYTANVGDSRIYLSRNSSIRQITVDHTWVQEAIDLEIIDPSEARNHPHAHMLQKAIGSPDPPEPDFRLRLSDDEDDEQSEGNQGLILRSGDIVLLCSDGLTDLVSDQEIQTAINEQAPNEAVQSLVSLARARGGHDNITIVILSVPVNWKLTKHERRRRVFLIGLIVILLIALIIAITFLGGWLFGVIPWPLGAP